MALVRRRKRSSVPAQLVHARSSGIRPVSLEPFSDAAGYYRANKLPRCSEEHLFRRRTARAGVLQCIDVDLVRTPAAWRNHNTSNFRLGGCRRNHAAC